MYSEFTLFPSLPKNKRYFPIAQCNNCHHYYNNKFKSQQYGLSRDFFLRKAHVRMIRTIKIRMEEGHGWVKREVIAETCKE